MELTGKTLPSWYIPLSRLEMNLERRTANVVSMQLTQLTA